MMRGRPRPARFKGGSVRCRGCRVHGPIPQSVTTPVRRSSPMLRMRTGHPGALSPGAPGSIFKISSMPSICLAYAIGKAKAMARGSWSFTYHRPGKRPAIVSAMEGPMNCWGREPRPTQMYRRSSLLALLSSTELTGPVVRAGPIDAQSGAAHYGSRGPRHGDRTAGLDDGLSVPHRSDVRRHAEKGADPIVEAIMAADGSILSSLW
jgi:hypothetical protein